MQNRAQLKESKCAKDILKCANEKSRTVRIRQAEIKELCMHKLRVSILHLLSN